MQRSFRAQMVRETGKEVIIQEFLRNVVGLDEVECVGLVRGVVFFSQVSDEEPFGLSVGGSADWSAG